MKFIVLFNWRWNTTFKLFRQHMLTCLIHNWISDDWPWVKHLALWARRQGRAGEEPWSLSGFPGRPFEHRTAPRCRRRVDARHPRRQRRLAAARHHSESRRRRGRPRPVHGRHGRSHRGLPGGCDLHPGGPGTNSGGLLAAAAREAAGEGRRGRRSWRGGWHKQGSRVTGERGGAGG